MLEPLVLAAMMLPALPLRYWPRPAAAHTPPVLTTVAHKVAATIPGMDGYDENTAWLPDGSAIVLANDGSGRYLAIKAASRSSANASSIARRIATDHPARALWDLRVSPNGLWMLWSMVELGPDQVWRTAELRGPGSSSGRVNSDAALALVWGPDSARFAGVARYGRLVYVSVYSKTNPRRYDVVRMHSKATIGIGTRTLGWLRSGVIIAADVTERSDDPRLASIPVALQSPVLWRLPFRHAGGPVVEVMHRSAKSPQAWAVRMPERARPMAVVLSRDGHTLAWELAVSHHAPGKTPWRTSELWVSGLRGERMRELGYVPVPADDSYATQGVQDVAWMLNGTALSFVLHGVLYTLPVTHVIGGGATPAGTHASAKGRLARRERD